MKGFCERKAFIPKINGPVVKFWFLNELNDNEITAPLTLREKGHLIAQLPLMGFRLFQFSNDPKMMLSAFNK